MTWLAVVAGIYVLICLLFYVFQHYFFFRPEILSSGFKYTYPFPFDEVHFDMEDGGAVNGIHFKVPNSLGVVFYLKGNSRSIKGWGKFAKDFLGKGYDFFMIDYRGFGKSRGKRNENKLYSDSQYTYKWLLESYPEEQIIVYGRSLGSGFAAQVASWNSPKMLILDSPYYSFEYNIKRFVFWLPMKILLRYKIPTNQFLQKVTCPIFIIHGKKDRLIPYAQSEMLKQEKPSVQLMPIIQGGHNNLPDFPKYHDYVYEILNP